MNTVTARRLDGLLLPLARWLSACRQGHPGTAVASLPPLAREVPAGSTVVVIKLVGLGSLTLLAPALIAYVKATGHALSLVTVEANRPLLELLDWPVQPVYLRSQSAWALATDVVRHLRRLRRLRPVAVIDLEFHSAFTALFGQALQAPLQAALDASWRRGLGTHGLVQPAQSHFAEFAGNLFSALAGTPLGTPPALPWRTAKLPPVRPKPAGRRRIVINVNAGIMCLERRLPRETFRDLMVALAAAVPAEFHLIGDPREANYTRGFASTLPGAILVQNHAGALTMPALLGLLRDADLVISNDTGPMHLACALGTPTLAIFGPESPARFGPRGPCASVVWGRMACGPCLTAENRKQAPCRGDNRCLRQVAAADLLPLALGLLAGQSGTLHCVGPRCDPPPGGLAVGDGC